MEILDLKIFCDLIENKSFTVAAEKNYLTQSAVSQRINKLIVELDEQIFIEKNKLLLSNKGKYVYSKFKDIISLIDQIKVTLKTGYNEKTVRIGFCETSKINIFNTKLIENIRSQNMVPIIYFGSSSDVFEKIIFGELDIGFIGNKPDNDTEIELTPISNEKILLVTSEKNNARDIVIKDIPLLMDHPSSGLFKYIQKELEKISINIEELNIVAFIGTAADKLKLIKKYNYYAFLPQYLLKNNKYLAPVDNEKYSFERTIYNIYKKKNKKSMELLTNIILSEYH